MKKNSGTEGGVKKSAINTNGLKLPKKRALVLPRATAKDEKRWFYIDAAGNELGPFASKEIRNRIGPGSYVWREGLSEWVFARETELFKTVAPTADTAWNRSEEIVPLSDKWAWSLATLPLIASWLMVVILDNAGCSYDEIVWTTIPVCVLLNTIFGILDGRAIERAGHDNPSLFLASTLVPVYLFVRAARITKQYAPAFLYCFIVAFNIYFTDQTLIRTRQRMARRSVAEALVNGTAVGSLSPKTETTDMPAVLKSVAGRHKESIALSEFCRRLDERFANLTEVQKIALEKVESGRPVVFCGEVTDVVERVASDEEFGVCSYISVQVKLHKGTSWEHLSNFLGEGVVDVCVWGSGQRNVVSLDKGTHVQITGEVYFDEDVIGMLRIKPLKVDLVHECISVEGVK